MYLELAVHDRHMDKEKSKSTEFLDKYQSVHLDTCSVLSARAHSTWDLSSGESCNIDKPKKFDETMFSKTKSSSKRSKVIPHSVKYAVSSSQKVEHSGVGGADTKTMSSKFGGTDVLDQTLNCIRAKLNTLQSERVEMETKVTHIMDDIRSALTQARYASIHKGRRPFVKSKSTDCSMNKQQSYSSQIFFPVHNTDQPMITATRELSPSEVPTSFFNRAGSMRQKLTSIMLSPTHFIRQAATSSKPSSLPPTHISADSICKINKKMIRNSMPECAIISTIPEDSIEAIEQLATKHKSYNKTEESLSSSNSMIIRRSSLTGQLEQYYKQPAQSMQDTTVKMRDRSDKVHAVERNRKATSMFAHSIITGSHPTLSPKYSINAIFLPSTETTV